MGSGPPYYGHPPKHLRPKLRHEIGGLFLLLAVLAFIALFIVVLAAAPKLFAWYDCGVICEANGHGNFYRLTQGCYCTDDDGKPYNPKDERGH